MNIFQGMTKFSQSAFSNLIQKERFYQPQRATSFHKDCIQGKDKFGDMQESYINGTCKSVINNKQTNHVCVLLCLVILNKIHMLAICSKVKVDGIVVFWHLHVVLFGIQLD